MLFIAINLVIKKNDGVDILTEPVADVRPYLGQIFTQYNTTRPHNGHDVPHTRLKDAVT